MLNSREAFEGRLAVDVGRKDFKSAFQHIEATSHWTVNSWDRTLIPKPFATVSVAIG